LFQSLLYCSKSCTSLHIKILKSHTKTLQIRPFHRVRFALLYTVIRSKIVQHTFIPVN
jgi:hypothetical protein